MDLFWENAATCKDIIFGFLMVLQENMLCFQDLIGQKKPFLCKLKCGLVQAPSAFSFAVSSNVGKFVVVLCSLAEAQKK